MIYGIHASPFGECLLAMIGDKVCHLSFIDDSHAKAVMRLKQEWKHEICIQDQIATQAKFEKIWQRDKNIQQTVQLYLKGTPFQTKVWKELLKIPFGETVSYQEVARRIGNPKAVRAAAYAIANNKISILIPCHRVIAKSGKIHKYRWGSDRKKAILDWEAKII
jgi:AraC family transcriptional regulator of adaptative response/methylated-DNA-[protein]-cysteine methyltransferase